MLMVENSTPVKEVNYESQQSNLIDEVNLEDSFESKIKGCIQQLAKEPKEKTIEQILNYSKTFRSL